MCINNTDIEILKITKIYTETLKSKINTTTYKKTIKVIWCPSGEQANPAPTNVMLLVCFGYATFCASLVLIAWLCTVKDPVIMLVFYYKLENTLNDKRQNYFNRVVILRKKEVLDNFKSRSSFEINSNILLIFNPVCQHSPCEIITLFCINIEREKFFLCDVYIFWR